MSAHHERRSFFEKFKKEAFHGFLLTSYFASWFSALSLLEFALLREHSISISPFGFAVVKAGLCSKFLLLSEAAYPLKVTRAHGILLKLFRHSIVYMLFVLFLTYVETGVDGVLHGKQFIESALSFGDRDPVRIVASALVYWLILCPYLVLRGIQDTIGSQEVNEILFGKRVSQ